MRPTELLAITARTLLVAGAFGSAHAAGNSPSCVKDSDQAAARFVTYSATDRAKSLALLNSVSLNQFRRRTQQLMDDQYSPGSREFRERTLGVDWSFARLKAATDREFAAAFMSAKSTSARVKDVAVLSHSSQWFGDEVVVGYTVVGGPSPGRRQRVLTVKSTDGCWTVEIPKEAWLQLDEVADQLKATRVNVPPTRGGPSSVSLKVMLASFTEASGMDEAQRRGVPGPYGRVWLSKEAILSEMDIESATSGSDCNVTSQGLEEPSVLLTFTDEGAERLKRWSSVHMGQTLAVTVEGEPIVVAKVAGVLGKKLSMCLSGADMDEANLMARQLMGWQK